MKNLLMKASVMVLVAALAVPVVTFASDSGGDLYNTKCATCHGKDGAGQTPMGKSMKLRDLGSADVQKQSDAELTTIVEKGKGKMPPFGGKLTADQVKEVVKYLRSLKK